MMEILEPRRHCSASLLNGLLSVLGTHKSDAIAISASSKRVYVRVNAVVTSFRLAVVKSIRVTGNRGADSINLGEIDIPGTLYGAGGNDQFIGGAARDESEGRRGYVLAGG